MTHPVLALLRSRKERGSAPGARTDPHRLALVIEGGGMRGVVSAAMTAELEHCGLTDCFDLVVGTSAGALNATAFVAGVAEGCAAAYPDVFCGRPFLNPYRLLVGKAAFNVAQCLDHASESMDDQRHERAVQSTIDLHCVAVDVATAQPHDLGGFTSAPELRGALLASSRIPWVGGPPAEFRGRRWLDGGLAEAIPVRTALANGATHLLVLQTRPEGVARSSPAPLVDRLVVRELHRLNPCLAGLYARRAADYEDAVSAISAATHQPAPGGPHICGVRLPAGTAVVSQLERSPEALRAAAATARGCIAGLLAGTVCAEVRR